MIQPLAVMKKCLWLWAGVAVLTGCGKHTDVVDNTPEEPRVSTTPVVVSQEKSGTFTVEANFDPGATFQNASETEETFEFTTQGEWTFAVGAGMLSPSGADDPASANFVLPGARSFAMVAKREDGTIEFAGELFITRLKPNETVSFSMNETMGSFGDNYGSLTVHWSIK
jgi:hypothetical protein